MENQEFVKSFEMNIYETQVGNKWNNRLGNYHITQVE